MRNTLLFILALLLALWFSVMGMVWTYFAALILAYPCALLSYVVWRVIRKNNKPYYIAIPVILLIGLLLSLVSLLLVVWKG